MTRTLIDWFRIITTCPARDHRFAGTPAVLPKPGDSVRIVRGLNTGATVEVVAIRGQVYATDQRVYVDATDGIPTWYNVWDVEIVESG